jgi:hypothetical protein
VSGFDRIKPPEQRLLERGLGPRLEPGGAPEAGREGRAALFTAGGAPERTPVLAGVALHCSGCDATTPLDAGVALRAALPLFLVAPWRDHPLFALCPACRRRAWLRPVPSGEESLSELDD